MTDMREIGPTYYFAPPRIFETLLTQVMIRMDDASAPKQWLFRRFMAVAKRCGAEIMDGKPGVSVVDRLLYRLGGLLIYGPLRNVLGMMDPRRTRRAPRHRIFRSIARSASTPALRLDRTCAYVCCSPTAGSTPSASQPGVEIADRKRRGDGPRTHADDGIHKRPDAIVTIDADTGDAGVTDPTATRIIDRAKDVGSRDGAISPPTISRTSSSSSPTSRRRWRSVTSATACARSSTSTWAR
jgi:long-chain acyl-CoA synthetase